MVLGVRGNAAHKAKRTHRVRWKRLGAGRVSPVGSAHLLHVPLTHFTRNPTNVTRYHNLLPLRPPRAARSAAGQNTFAIIAGTFTQVPHVVAVRLPQCRRGAVASS